MEVEQAGEAPLTPITYTASIDGRSYSVIIRSERQLEVNGNLFEYDFVELRHGFFSLLLNGKVYAIEVPTNPKNQHREQQSGNAELGGTVLLRVGVSQFQVRVDDERSLLLRSLFKESLTSSGTQVVCAPMPGLISRIEVQVAEEVEVGRGLLVLEAMKMENEIRAPHRGKIQMIHVQKGRAVEKGQPLVTIQAL